MSTFDAKDFVRNLSSAPGVYRMIGADEGVLYVGKASALRNRVASYFNNTPKSARIASMVSQVARVEVTVTRTEAEALILENELIKSLKPRYNVLLRDDKSYPYVLLTHDEFPRISVHRGPRAAQGRYFGPYASVGAVRESLNLMHKLFKLRSCEDTVFRNRSRPCLQFQIGRCSAPCVALVSPEEYGRSVRRASLMLEGRSDELTHELGAGMERAAADLDFEEAARLRDLVASIRTLQARQYVDGRAADLDVLSIAMQGANACVVLMAFRDGRNLGTRTFFPRTNGSDQGGEVLGAFVSQFYVDKTPPREIVIDRDIPDRELLEQALSMSGDRRVQIRCSVRGERAGYLDIAGRTAQMALASEMTSASAQRTRVESLRDLLGMAHVPGRIECFDISHTMGEATVASCVVFDAEGPVRGQYRRYNITGVAPGDDYAAMHQAIHRRFRRAADAMAGEGEAPSTGTGPGASPSGRARDGAAILPDILLIDGGAGQVGQARAVLEALGIEGVQLVGVAKGPERRPGDEDLLLPDGRCVHPGAQSPALQLVQQVRDEAHRFAITGHRGRRQKARTTSRLEDIPGIGPRRRAALLRHFGGLGGLRGAGVEEIARVEGVNAALAQRIYDTLHGLAPSEGAE